MLSTKAFIQDLTFRGFKLFLRDGKLVCKAPKGALTPEIQALIKAHRDDMVAQLEADARPIPALQREAATPAGFAQTRLWVLDRFSNTASAYNMAGGLYLRGRLDEATLINTFRTVLARHEALRTSFRQEGATPLQVVDTDAQLALTRIDLTALDEGEREQTSRSLIESELRRPFDLTRGPLFRVYLVRREVEDHLLLVNMHHIVSDGWSMGVLIREFLTLYAAYHAKLDNPLPPLPIQYPDFTAWQQQHLQGANLDRQIRYWRERLDGLPPLSSPPTDKPRPAVQTFGGKRIVQELPRALSDGLNALAREERATLFMVLQAGFAVVLARYCRQDDVALGTIIANRSRPELEQLIGFFANTLVMRVQLRGDQSFRDLLAQVRADTFEAYAHQDLPFERLVEELQPERNLAFSPLFQVMFVLQNTPTRTIRLPELAIELLDEDTGTAKFDINFMTEEHETGLRQIVQYNTDLFEERTMRGLLAQYARLLEAVVADPDTSVRALSMLPSSEAVALRELSRIKTPQYHGLVPLVRRFEAWVDRHPEAIALSLGSQSFSYAALEGWANRIANYLIDQGVGSEDLVALYCERSFAMLAAILGVHKAGAAYLPLDPDHPRERLAFTLEDANAKLVLTDDLDVRELSDTPVRLLDGFEDQRTTRPKRGIELDTASYVIYTSGSTGKPKGCIITHRNLSRLFAACDDDYRFDREVWTLFHSYAFDFSVWEIWGALAYGGRLVITPRDLARDPARFAQLLADEGVTVLNQTPSAFANLIPAVLTQSDIAERIALKWVVFGGEALDPKVLAPWYDRFGDSAPRLVNMYGITETTVHVTFRALEYADIHRPSLIGRPIDDLSLHVLDDDLQPAPFNVQGELFVGGAGSARGYLNRPALTAQRFLPDPFGPAGSRLYRSGDLARIKPNGDIAYVGRADFQIKLRGFRIELGEIQAVLEQLEGVAQAVVLLVGEGEQRRLAAYLAVRDGVEPDLAEIRRQAAKRLPEYMAPAHFITLESLPLTVNGKLDVRALPKPDLEQHETQFVAPRNPLEHTLTELWCKALSLDRVGVHDNFFALGFDSIRGVTVLALAREQGLDVAMTDLFTHQSVAELAAAITDRDRAIQADQGTEAFELLTDEERAALPQGLDDAYPIPAMAAGMLLHAELDPERPAYHNVTDMHVRGALDPDHFRQALADVMKRHPVLRSSIHSAGRHLHFIHRDVTPPFTFEDISHLDADAQAQRIGEERARQRRQTFELSRAPLFRIHVLRRSREDFQFFWIDHHAILDGWSVTSLFTECFNRYFQRIDGQVADTAPLSETYGDYVALELRESERAEARDFWRTRVADLPRLRVPRPPYRHRTTPHEPLVTRSLPEALTAKLRALAETAGVPFKSVLFTAYLRLLGRLCRSQDVVTGMTTNGRRETEEGAKVLGLFLNSLPVRVDLSADSWFELILRVFREETALLEHRRTPLVQLQQLAGGTALFETYFNFINFHSLRDMNHLDRFQVLSQHSYQKPNFTLSATFRVDPFTDACDLMMDYDPDALGFDQVAAWVEALIGVLETMVAAPEAAPHITLADESTRRMAFNALNQQHLAVDHERLVHELFEHQADLRPDAPFILDGDHTLSLGEAETSANRLAHWLQSQDVTTETPVALHLANSAHFVIALLATLKAGGAYVPIDPAFPEGRIQAILDDVRPALILSATPDTLAKAVDLNTLDLSNQPETRPATNAFAENLCYQIYTSGSTGKPKGVGVSHRALVNFVQASDDILGANQHAIHATLTTVAADLGYTTLYGAICGGRPYRIIPKALMQDPDAFATELAKHPVDRYKTVPSHLGLLLNATNPTDVLPKETLILAGEQLDTALVTRIKDVAPDLKVINYYGPTEATVSVTAWPASPVESACPERVQRVEGQRVEGEPIPIGVPFANNTAYIVDAQHQLVATNEPGELLLGGENLARGYHGRPAATAERFTPDPFSNTPGTRLYRSGDLVRLLPEGAVEFLGRIDDQVKIRGYRVEPREAQAHIIAHDQVDDALVMARPDARGELRLVAYVITTADADALRQDLGRYLKQKLPEYLIPSAFVFLENLPLTVNGKIDRARLPEPEALNATITTDGEPRTPTEALLAEIWATVLNLPKVGRHDTFFDLGAHSITTALVASRIRKAFGVQLPLKRMFQAQTVVELAEIVEAERAGERFNSMPAAPVPIPRDGRLPLSFAQSRMWFLDRMTGPNTNYNMADALTFEGVFHQEHFLAAVDAVIARHEILRSTFPDVNGEPTVHIAPLGSPDIRIHDLADLDEDAHRAQLKHIEEDNVRTTFVLSTGPLLRVDLVRLAPTTHALYLNMHHITSDGWSLGVFTRELTELYQARLDQREPDLPELTIQYVDLAHWQRQWLQGAELARQLSWWKTYLKGLPPYLDLPIDRPRPAELRHHGDVVPFSAPLHVLEGLKALGRRQDATLFMITLAAYMVLLSRHSGQDDLAVGSANAGRSEPSSENLIGLFINTMALRGRPGHHDSFLDFLDELRRDLLDVYDHQDIPFEQLVNELGVERNPSYMPIYQVMFTLRTKDESHLELPGLEISPRRQTLNISRFDMILFVSETDQGVEGLLEYRTDLFDHHSIQAMTQDYVSLLHAIAATPERAPRDLPLRDPAAALPALAAGAEHRPLTPVQQWRWLTDSPLGELESAAVQLEGAPDLDRLQTVVDAFAKDRERLRLRFHIAHHRPYATLGEPAPIVINAQQPPTPEAPLQLLVHEDVDVWFLELRGHRLIGDRTTLIRWADELAAAYVGQDISEPDPPLNTHLFGPELTRRLAYWRDYLAAAPASPMSALAQGQDDGERSYATFTLGQLPDQDIAHLTCAALAVLFYRYTGQDDLLIIARVPGGVEPVETRPVRLRLDEDTTGATLIHHIQCAALDGHELPFERLIHHLHPSDHLFLDLTRVGESPTGTARRQDFGTDAPGFLITLHLTQTPSTLHGRLGYPSSRFDQTLIERFLADYQTLIVQLLDAPTQQLLDFALTEDESERETAEDVFAEDFQF